MLIYVLSVLGVGLLLGGIVHFLDLHIAIYRPKAENRGLDFLFEMGNPDTSKFKDW